MGMGMNFMGMGLKLMGMGKFLWGWGGDGADVRYQFTHYCRYYVE